MLRRLLERSMRRLVFRRRLPTEFASAVLYVSPAAGLRYIFRPMANIDPPLLMAAHTLVRRDDVIWDIGANVGLFFLSSRRFVQATAARYLPASQTDGLPTCSTTPVHPLPRPPITLVPLAGIFT